MKLKLLLTNFGFWLIIYALVLTFGFIGLIVKYYNYECPEPNIPEITEANQKKINEINDAQTKDDIDSLLLELYGFKSE